MDRCFGLDSVPSFHHERTIELVFCFYFHGKIYPVAGAVGMWKSQAAFLPDFSKRLREATLFVAFRTRVISTAGLRASWFARWRWRVLVVLTAVARSFCCSFSICRLSCAGFSKR